MRISKVLAYMRGQWAGFLALFLVLSGGTAYATGTVGTADLQNKAVTTPKLADEAVTGAKISAATITGDALAPDAVDGSKILNNSVTSADLAPDAVDGSKILNNSVTSADLAGADASLRVSLPARAVRPGRCIPRNIAVAGAQPGQVPLLAVLGQVPKGIVFTAQRVPSAGNVSVEVCNLSDQKMRAISNLQLRIMTFG